MLDIQVIRDDPNKVKKGISDKGYDASLVDKVLDLDKQYRVALQEEQNLRAARNLISKDRITPDIIQKALEISQISLPQETKDTVQLARELAKEIKNRRKGPEVSLKKIKSDLEKALYELPNLPLSDVLEGKGEKDNKVIRQVGEPKEFTFTPKEHVEIAQTLDLIDFERGSKVAGADFYYLKNEGVLLELALVHYGMDFLRDKGFIPVITPDLARERYYIGTGYLPKGPEAQTYVIDNSDLGLIATAEVTLAGYHADEILEKKELPKLYAGYSHCFRVESGGYGKYSKGLYRVHQFSKVEMFVYCDPDESEKSHEELLSLEEEFWKSLGIPYRVVEMCTGDLGAQAARKFDLEAWMPGRGDWGEVTSTSNTTDYQARRLNIKYKEGGENKFVHTLNGTLVAVSRALISILENFQQEDGTVAIPKVLQKYTGFSEIKPK